MKVYRCILPLWAKEEYPQLPKTVEGQFSQAKIEELNGNGYNIYYLPNYPKNYDNTKIVDGTHVDTFEWIYADMDLKDEVYADKDEFLYIVSGLETLKPTKIVDSGNGIHLYWRVSDLDAMSFLKLQRRICRLLSTDEAVSKIYQLMREPNTVNTKHKDAMKVCEILSETDSIYTCEQLDDILPRITPEDESYCKNHYDKTYSVPSQIQVSDKIPLKFQKLVKENKEVRDLWIGDVDDRSKSDFRLAHVMHGNGFTKDEAMSVLVNAAKALQRAPKHRVSYASNIVDQIWTYELEQDKTALTLSSTVREILNKHGDAIKGTKLPCWSYLDNTLHGFRLGQVIGLVAGSGVGKTATALNMFMGFVQNNPDYDHFFIPLEQPANEIADRWKTMCGDKEHLYDKVHVLSNYNEDGSFRHLSFEEIKDYLLKFQEITKRKVGCVVLDHIGALKKKGKDGENQDLMNICHSMKAFAVQTNTLLVMQSQAPREKAGIGDLELNKDAAYGTVFFESYCDYLITIWQPLKRCYAEKGCPTVTAFKFCKIRHKKTGMDKIQEDLCYRLFFDPKTEHLRDLTETEEKSFDFFLKNATSKRKQDRKTDIIPYNSIVREEPRAGTVSNSKDLGTAKSPDRVH